MNEKAFFEKLADAFQVNAGDINEAFELNSDILDSVTVLDIIAVIDEEFGVTVPSKELKTCTSVGALLDLVHSHGAPQISSIEQPL